MRIAREVALYNQGSIENGIDDASKVATSFITFVSSAEGIKVHNADDLSDYVQVNSNNIAIYRDNTEKMQLTDESLRLGDTSNHALIDADGMDVVKGGTSVAAFGTESRVGAENAYNVLTDTTGIAFRESAEEKFKITAETEGYYNVANLESKTDYSLSRYTSYVSADSIVAGYALGRIEAIDPDGTTAPYANVTVRRTDVEAVTSVSNHYSNSVGSTLYLVSSANDNHVLINSDEIHLNGDLYNNGTPVNPLKVTKTSVSSLPTTISNSAITVNMEVINSVLSNPSAQTGDWTVTTSAGSAVISGSISGTTNITLYLAEPST